VWSVTVAESLSALWGTLVRPSISIHSAHLSCCFVYCSSAARRVLQTDFIKRNFLTLGSAPRTEEPRHMIDVDFETSKWSNCRKILKILEKHSESANLRRSAILKSLLSDCQIWWRYLRHVKPQPSYYCKWNIFSTAFLTWTLTLTVEKLIVVTFCWTSRPATFHKSRTPACGELTSDVMLTNERTNELTDKHDGS